MSNECPDDLFDDPINVKRRERQSARGTSPQLNYQGAAPSNQQGLSSNNLEVLDFSPDWCDSFQDDDCQAVQQSPLSQQEHTDSLEPERNDGLRKHRKHLRLVNPDHYAYSGVISAPAPSPVTPAVSVENTAMFILERLASDPFTPPSFLQQIAEHPDGDLRAIVAENQNAPAEVIEMLAQDADVNVRYQLAENHNISVIVLQTLSQDENAYVACRAKQTLERLLW